MIRYKSKIRVTLLVLCFLLLTLSFNTNIKAASLTDDVLVRAKVNYNPTIIVYPEKRVPLVNHWMNENIIEIRVHNSTTPIITEVANFDQYGEATIGEVDSLLVPFSGNYDIAVKGYSHIREVYPNNTFVGNQPTFNLTLTGMKLLAGDMNNDNYINSMDINYQINHIYKIDNIRSDVNRDDLVNSLDISNAATNLYKYGKN